MTLNELTAVVIDVNDVWHEQNAQNITPLSEACGGTIAAVKKLEAAVAAQSPAADVRTQAANVIFGALLCAYQAGLEDADGVVQERLAQLRAQVYR